MAVTDADLSFRYSINTGPGGSTAQADPDDSLGGFASSTAWAGGSLHDLFDAVSGDENAALDVEYRCIFVKNSHATDTAGPNGKLWLSANAAGGADIAIGLDPAGAVAGNSASAQAIRINDEGDSGNELSGVTFSAPTSKATGIALPNLTAGQVVGVWVRRTATDSGAVSGDGFTLDCEFDAL